MDPRGGVARLRGASVSQNHVVLAILILLGTGGLVLWFGAGLFNHGVNTRLELLGIFVTSVLTIALIAVYADIAKRERIQSRAAERLANLQETQTEFQKKQIDLQKELTRLQEDQQRSLEANHKPVIQITDWNVESFDNQDRVNLDLKNKGNGLAQNLHVVPNIYVQKDLSHSEVYIDINDLEASSGGPGGTKPHASPVSPRSSMLAGESGAVVQSGEGGEYRAKIQFHRDKFDMRDKELKIVETLPFSEVLKRFNQMETVQVSLELEYENILGEKDSVVIYSEQVSPQGAETLAELTDRERLSHT